MNENEDKAREPLSSEYIEQLEKWSRHDEHQRSIPERQAEARQSYPPPARILAGPDLKRAAGLYLDLAGARILGRLVELEEQYGPALDGLISPDGSVDYDGDLLERFIERRDLSRIVYEAENGYIPYLYRTAHSHGLDPGPFVRCRVNLTRARLEDAIALAERLLTIAESPPEDHAASRGLSGGVGDSVGPALTANQSRVLQTMARFDASRLLSSGMIVEEMDAASRLSDETTRQCVGRLIGSGLAERPEGKRSGARLTNAGRRLAGKIAD